MTSRVEQVFGTTSPIVGVVHLPPLPGYPGSPGMTKLVEHALADLAVMQRAGLAGALVENEHDRPHRVLAAADTVAAMTVIAHELVRASRGLAIGVEILLNDPEASLAVALAAGASFVRTDYFVDRMRRPEHGELRIDPEAVIAYRERIGAGDVVLLADIQVKYAELVEPRGLDESAALASRLGADAVVVSGSRTGEPPSAAELAMARAGATVPVLVGSGLDPSNAAELLRVADGAIVGTSILRDGHADLARAERLVRAAHSA